MFSVLHALIRSRDLVFLCGTSYGATLQFLTALEEELAEDTQGLVGPGNVRAHVLAHSQRVTHARARARARL